MTVVSFRVGMGDLTLLLQDPLVMYRLGIYCVLSHPDLSLKQSIAEIRIDKYGLNLIKRSITVYFRITRSTLLMKLKTSHATGGLRRYSAGHTYK